MRVLYTCGPAETRDSGATFLRHLAGEPPGDPDKLIFAITRKHLAISGDVFLARRGKLLS